MPQTASRHITHSQILCVVTRQACPACVHLTYLYCGLCTHTHDTVSNSGLVAGKVSSRILYPIHTPRVVVYISHIITTRNTVYQKNQKQNSNIKPAGPGARRCRPVVWRCTCTTHHTHTHTLSALVTPYQELHHHNQTSVNSLKLTSAPQTLF